MWLLIVFVIIAATATAATAVVGDGGASETAGFLVTLPESYRGPLFPLRSLTSLLSHPSSTFVSFDMQKGTHGFISNQRIPK